MTNYDAVFADQDSFAANKNALPFYAFYRRAKPEAGHDQPASGLADAKRRLP
jgi:hypothetical protein